MERFVFDETQPTGTMSLSNLRENFKALFMMDLLPLRVRAHDTPDMSVAIDACGDTSAFFDHVYIGSAPLSYAGGSTSEITAPLANPRLDIVKIDGDGTVGVIAGAEAVSPVAEWGSLASDEIPLALLYLTTGMSSIVDYEDKDANPTEGYIYKDVRPFLNLGKANFIDLTDTFSAYDNGKFVKSTGSSIVAQSAVLNDLSDTSVSSPSNGNILKYSTASSTWIASNEELVKDTSPQLGGDLDLNSHNIDFPTTPNISDCLDEDDMASNSATKLATQQSIKAYVDGKSTHSELFTSSGTFTVPSGVSVVFVTMVGGGGGSAGTGGGGGGGQSVIKYPVSVTPAGNYTITVGSGGNGSTSNNGASGGNSSFSTLITVYGGGGANYADSLGGSGGGGVLDEGGASGIKGGDGGDSPSATLGAGGSSLFGKGGGASGSNGTGYGSGGSGGSTTAGNGSAGFVLVEW